MRGTKLINYSTPKHVMLRLKKDRSFIASKKRPGYCLKAKGPHNFIQESKEKSIVFNEWVTTYKCAFCGKKKIARELA